MSSVCRYCNKVELAFDNTFKSKTGKLIPLDKTSGLPHQCSENPYSKQQQPQQPQQQEFSTTVTTVEPTSLKIINAKLDRIIALLQESQK